MSSEIGRIFAAPALAALGRHTPATDAVRRLAETSAARLVDSLMAVEDSLAPFRIAQESRVSTTLPNPPVMHAIRALIGQVEQDGFGPHAARFFGMLGAVMVSLAGTEAQAARVMGWAEAGLTGAFAMTDRGGPLAQDWRSVLSTTTPALTVDKVWSMNAHRADFGIVVVRQGQSMVLATAVIPPEVWATADRRACGAAFLDGALPLGDVKLTVETADPDWFLRKGGPIAAKVFLTLARPWLIQALCAHARWLSAQGRLTLDACGAEAVAWLDEAARNQAALGAFDRFSEDQAMALKWIANETWLHLVTSGCVPAASDQRDLIGFSKMEGSSYRCFHEIYERNKRSRHADA